MKLTLTDLVLGFLCLLIYLPFLFIGMAVFAVVEAIHTIQRK